VPFLVGLVVVLVGLTLLGRVIVVLADHLGLVVLIVGGVLLANWACRLLIEQHRDRQQIRELEAKARRAVAEEAARATQRRQRLAEFQQSMYQAIDDHAGDNEPRP